MTILFQEERRSSRRHSTNSFMPTYPLHALNVGSFALGESDKIITVFSAERGLSRLVAKGARKPGTKISGRADVLNVNKLLVAKGKSLDIITQAETIQSFGRVRNDLTRLAYCLYYAELTHQFGQGVADESESYFEFVCAALGAQAEAIYDPAALCLKFEMGLLEQLGYKPELTYCVACRSALHEATISGFNNEMGGIVCGSCVSQGKRRAARVREAIARYSSAEEDLDDYEDFQSADDEALHVSKHITPLVWKSLILASGSESLPAEAATGASATPSVTMRAARAARRLLQSYLEHRAGRRMKSLDLIDEM